MKIALLRTWVATEDLLYCKSGKEGLTDKHDYNCVQPFYYHLEKACTFSMVNSR